MVLLLPLVVVSWSAGDVGVCLLNFFQQCHVMQSDNFGQWISLIKQ